MPGVEIRDAGDADLPGLIALEERTFATDRMDGRSLRRLLKRRTALLRVAVTRRRSGEPSILGYHLVLVRKGSAVARLYSIAVDAASRGRGLGRRLLADAETVAQGAGRGTLRLEVHERNRAAIALYRRRGYRPIGRIAAYYGDGGDALRYEKGLAAPARSRRVPRRRGKPGT